MNLSCGSRTIKYLMFTFNLFFVISGIIIIAVGATVKAEYSQYEDILNSQYFTLPNMLIATGVLIFLISFVGCCGAFKESWIMLGIFSILLGIIFIFELASGIAGYVLRDKTYDYLDTTLRRDLLLYNSTHVVWDLIQGTFQCCGVDGYDDWNTTLNDYALPLSCCPSKSGTNGVFYCNSYNVSSATTTTTTTTTTPPSSDATSITSTAAANTETTTINVTTTDSDITTSITTNSTTTNSTTTNSTATYVRVSSPDKLSATPSAPSTTTPYSIGCKSAFGAFIKKHAIQIGGCAIGLAVIQILGIVFSCYLVRQLRSGNL